MDVTTECLSSEIMTFIAILNQCLSETTFATDGRLYAEDLATAKQWLTRLAEGKSPAEIAATILEPATAKHYTDYWRQGSWGDLESKALANLQDQIRRCLDRGDASTTTGKKVN